ncbi:MAG: inositol monophosphatase family protein [Actinomycetes bacterium]
MSTPDPLELLELAVEAADQASRLLVERQSVVTVAATKSSPTDVVTAADTAAERLIRDVIRGRRPDDSVLGEELDSQDGRSSVRWVVDPLDGTVNYLYGLPLWSVSIAAEIDGMVVAACVDVAALDRRYTATRAGGAFCNDTAIAVSSVSELPQALLATGFSYEADVRAAQGAAVAKLLPQVRDVRRLGSAALDLCLVAHGQVDAFYERGLQPWDAAAGGLIAAEAGAVVQRSGDRMAAASPLVAAAFFALLDDVGA